MRYEKNLAGSRSQKERHIKLILTFSAVLAGVKSREIDDYYTSRT
jgi:hypothetical protein